MAHLRNAAEAGRDGDPRHRLSPVFAMPVTEAQRKANVRLALILATLALAFGIGFVVKIWWLGP